VRVQQDDFAMGILGLFFCGALAALTAPTNLAAAFFIVAALLLLTAAAIWAARDAAELPDETWRAAGRNKRVWTNILLFLAPLGLGGLAAIAYFAAVRPQLDQAGDHAEQRPDEPTTAPPAPPE
jgi:hypothetical protein